MYNVELNVQTAENCPLSSDAFVYVLPLLANVQYRRYSTAFAARPTSSDVTLQAIEKINYYFPNAIDADRHFATDLKPYVQVFEHSQFDSFLKQYYDNANFNMQQAHGASSAYDTCAVILSSKHHIVCAGSQATQVIHAIDVSAATPQRVLAVAYFNIGNTGYVLWTQGQAHPFDSVIKMREIGGATTSTIQLPQCSTWISLSMYKDNIVDNQHIVFALEYHLSELQVSMYKMQVTASTQFDVNIVRQYIIPVTLPNYKITTTSSYAEDEWMRHCRVVHGKHAEHGFVACVHKTVDDSNDVLKLYACLLIDASSACQQIVMTSSVTVNPSLIPISFLRTVNNVEKWVMSCNNEIFVYEYAHTLPAAAVLKRVRQSDLTQKHFVRVQSLFYILSSSIPQHASKLGIMTYLPNFKRWTSCSNTQAQAILIMPGASSASAKHNVHVDIRLLHNSIDPTTNETSYVLHSIDGTIQVDSSDVHSFGMHVFDDTVQQ